MVEFNMASVSGAIIFWLCIMIGVYYGFMKR